MIKKLMVTTAVALCLTGCATPVVEQERTGFLSDYSALERLDENAYRYTSPKVRNYNTFIVDQPELSFDTASSGFSDDELDEITAYFQSRVEKALTERDGYRVVSEPGSGVARLRLSLTALDATIGALNLTIYTKITGAGLGGAAMEGELIDSLSGEQLAAAVQWGSGSRVLRAGLTKLGDAKLQINRWTANLRKRIDDAHAGRL